MKTVINMNKKAIKTNRRSRCQVRLDFTHPEASEVFVAGTFNDWKPQVTPMIPLGNGRWIKILVLPPGDYEYLFFADGKWIPDPHATRTVPNPFGGVNSVLEVERSTGANGAQRPSRFR